MNGPQERFDVASYPDWQVLINHFEFGRGFGLIVLLTADGRPGRVRRQLEACLEPKGKRVLAPASLNQDGIEGLLCSEPQPDVGAVWLERSPAAELTNADAELTEWKAAILQLNSRSHQLSRKWDVPVVFSGPTWVQKLLLEFGPDLWAIRTLVISVEASQSAPSAVATTPPPYRTGRIAEKREREDFSDPCRNLEQRRLFISYSHVDRRWLERLTIALKPLIRVGVLDIWDDRRISVGNDWRERIRHALESADVAVLLVTAPFLASDFIYRDELPPILDAAENEGLVIVWIAIGFCLYKKTKLVQYQAANNPERPLCALRAWERDRELARIAELIEEAAYRNAQGRGSPPTNARSGRPSSLTE